MLGVHMKVTLNCEHPKHSGNVILLTVTNYSELCWIEYSYLF